MISVLWSSLVEGEEPGEIYEDLVVRYWNWLLSSGSGRPIVGNVLYCRACYEYRDVVSIDNEVRRLNNLCGSAGNEVDVNSGVKTDTNIFWPFIDAQFNSTHRQHEPDRNFDETLMRAACNFDIDRTERDRQGRFPSVPSIRTGSGAPEDIVDRAQIESYRMEVPQKGTFDLEVPEASPLRDRLEDPSPRHGTYQATAVGYYLIFRIKRPGTYTIRSSARGPREYRAIMTYHVTVS